MTPSKLKVFFESPEFAFLNAYLEKRSGEILQGFAILQPEPVMIANQQGRLHECKSLTENLKEELNEFLRHNSKET